MDIKGPILKGTGRAKYILSFIDEYSRYAVSDFIISKSEVPKMFKNYTIKSKNETGKRIKSVFSDNAKEFRSCELDLLMQDENIEQKFSTPYTPQEYGIIECFHYTIGTKTTAALLHAR